MLKFIISMTAVTLIALCDPQLSSLEAEENAPKRGVKQMADSQVQTKGATCYATEIDKLSPEQFRITQENGTERPFSNAYWNKKDDGIYVDVVSGEPLFSSLDKFDSGTGWPSFSKPIKPEVIVEKQDKSLGMARTEARSAAADSHLGHIFPDGPGPNGMRYCINSASLRFIPVADLEQEGYGEFLGLFSSSR